MGLAETDDRLVVGFSYLLVSEKIGEQKKGNWTMTHSRLRIPIVVL